MLSRKPSAVRLIKEENESQGVVLLTTECNRMSDANGPIRRNAIEISSGPFTEMQTIVIGTNVPRVNVGQCTPRVNVEKSERNARRRTKKTRGLSTNVPGGPFLAYHGLDELIKCRLRNVENIYGGTRVNIFEKKEELLSKSDSLLRGYGADRKFKKFFLIRYCHAIYPARVILEAEERRKEKEEEVALFPADWILACVGEEMPTQRATTYDDVEKKENESREKEEETIRQDGVDQLAGA
ncbi:hypothetical protein V1478_017254, partial [Vespula squamosa]